MYDFEHIQVPWNSSWSQTVQDVEQILGTYEITARNTAGFVSWSRSKPIASSAYLKSENADDHSTYPYCLINYIVVRPMGITKLHQYYVEVTGLPVSGG